MPSMSSIMRPALGVAMTKKLVYTWLMKLFKRIPKWIKSLPEERDRRGLTELAKISQGDLSKPRSMNFVLYNFDGRDSIDNAIAQISARGWNCAPAPQGDGSGKTIIECKKDGYTITKDTFMDDTGFFQRIADLYGADYDGWGTHP